MDWIVDHLKEILIGGASVAQVVLWPLLVRWGKLELKNLRAEADDRYEPKRNPRTPEEQALRIDSLARQILSGPVIKEFADNTVQRAFELPEFRKSVEETVELSLPIERRIDARIKHKQIDEDLKQEIRFERFRNEIGGEIRQAVNGSQTAIFEKIDLLFEKLGELQSIQMRANK